MSTTSENLRGAARGAGGQAKPAARTIFEYLDDARVRTGIAKVAGQFLRPDRMLTLCVNAVKKTPRLLECDSKTVLGAMMASAALGLEPNTVQQQAFLIPYKRRALIGDQWCDVYDCQFQIGARGFITLAYRSPLIKSISSGAIHQGDRFEHLQGSETFLRYAVSLANRGELIGSFSHVKLTNGNELACVLPLDEIEKIRGKSETYRSLVYRLNEARENVERAKGGEASKAARELLKAEQNFAETPWVMWVDDMASKTAIKKHAKGLPLSPNDQLAVAAQVDRDGDGTRLDLAAFTDPDVVSSVMDGEADPPALGHDTSGEEFADQLAAAQRKQQEQHREPVGAAGTTKTRRTPTAAPPAPPPAPAAPPPPASADRMSILRAKMVGAATQDARDEVLDVARTELPAEQYDEIRVLHVQRSGA